MYPDPSIVHVGADYFLVNSTFAFYPGVPIFHSRDLVHWKQIGSVLNRPGQLKLDGLQVSQGVYAPSIRFHNGTFYMINTIVGGVGNFYVTARNPAGPWSDPVLLPEIEGIDPSFFFDDDGKAYIVHNGAPPDNKSLYPGHRAIWLFPFDPKSGKVSGAGHVLVNGGTDISKQPTWIEGPHLFQHGGFYYLIAAEGGTSTSHSEVVFRSKSLDQPFLPYEHNPILTQRDLPATRPGPIADTGHADFTEDGKGNWWAVFLGVQPYRGDLYNTGRETFMLPVHWVDGWPVILPAGAPVPRRVKAPDLASSPIETLGLHGSFTWKDNFREQQLRPEWEMLRTPTSNWWSLNREPGELSLAARADDLIARGNPSFLGHRQQQAEFSTSIVLHLDGQPADTDAGIVAFQNEHAWFFLGVSALPGQASHVFVEQGTGDEAMPRKLSLQSIALPAGAKQVTLKIAGNGGSLDFFYQVGTSPWTPLMAGVDSTSLSTAKAGGFVGTYLGPFARLYTTSQ
jgi:alpha-N-arabinofuranosidase